MASDASLISRLSSVRKYAENIMNIGGTPGAAIVILHEGELVFSEYLGLRDQENQLPVDAETIFPCASLTKSVFSAAMAICVEERLLDWNTPVKDIVPGFHTQDETLHQQMTSVDCLSHRAGMQSTLYWVGSHNNVLVPCNKSLDFVNDLERVHRFRDHYLYNNLGDEIAAHTLSSISGNAWDHVLHNRIFQPLGMGRTGTRPYFQTDNVAKTYMTLDDASNVEITPMLSGGDTMSARNALDWYPKLEAELSRKKSSEPPPRGLLDYVGTYHNSARTMILQVSVNEQNGMLSVIFEGLKDEAWTLFHKHADVFTWLVPRNTFAQRGRFTTSWFDAEYFKINFYEDSDNSHIAGLAWKHDQSLQGPQHFMKG